MSEKEPVMTRQYITDGKPGAAAMQKNMASALSGLRTGETLQAYAARRDEVVKKLVASIIAAIEGADAFDVIDLMRQREVIAKRSGYCSRNGFSR